MTTATKTGKKNSPMMKIMKAEPELFSVLKEGDLVQARFLEQKGNEVFFDLNRFGTGIVFGREFNNGREIVRGLKLGDVINAKVAEVDGESGFTELSLTEADKHKIWQEFKEMKERDEILKVLITAANAGGLLTEVKEVKAFLPVSQLSNEHYPRVADNNKEKILEELKEFVGKELEVKIMTVNSKLNKLIISEREISDKGVQEMLKNYKTGDIVEGIISGVADFGAFLKFADHPEVEGLIHISELDHKLVENPKEIVKVNDAVKAMVTEIKDGRVSLSLKALKPDPWKNMNENIKEGEKVKGVPFKFNPFGAFVNVEGADVQGLIHVSEFGGVDEMKKELELGKKYDFIIDVLKPEEKRLILKIKTEKKKEKEKKTEKEN
ncbi:MAG: S1 RNA-binding domain-containing protein [Candidatus Pacebacteria bacterium]|nr:S1 RNA-binding domain-containing protein [Candidatus Paceibacterota bacterium]